MGLNKKVKLIHKDVKFKTCPTHLSKNFFLIVIKRDVRALFLI